MNNTILSNIIKFCYKKLFTKNFKIISLTNYILFITSLFFLKYFQLYTLQILFFFTVFFLWSIFILNYVDYKYNIIKKDNYIYELLFDQLPMGIVIIQITNNMKNIKWINNKFRIIINSKKNITNINEIPSLFSEYPTLEYNFRNIINNVPSNLEVSFGHSTYQMFSQNINKNHEILSIMDITKQNVSSIDFENLLKNILNKMKFGVIICDNNNIIIFANHHIDSIINLDLTGKIITNIPEFQNNIYLKNNDIFHITIINLINNYKLYKIEQQIVSMNKIIHQCPFGIVIIDKYHKIFEVNNYITNKISDKIPNSMKNIEDLIHKNQRKSFKEYFNEFVQGRHLEASLFNTIYNASTMIYIKKYTDNHYILYLMEDHTLRLPLYKFLHEQRVYSIGELAGSIAHDFNNHIMAILATTDTLLDQYICSINDNTSTKLMNIKHNASRVANLIKQILNASNRTSNDIEEVIDVNEYISDFLNNIGRILTNNIDVKFEKSEKIPYVAMNDIHLEQILINLMNNAKYAIQKTKNKPEIKIYTDLVNFNKFFVENGFCVSSGDYARIIVEDTGCGVSTENIKKIFEPFFTTKSKDGTGLGLFSVNLILKQYKGFIKIKSTIGEGSKFIIHIPLCQQNKIETVVNHEKKILFVEDEESIRSFIESNLSEYNITITSNSIEAINKSETMNNIDILITDLMLNTLSGVDLYNKLKQKFPSLIVLFISGYGRNIVNVPNSYFLQKPFSIKELKNMINRILESLN